jgi:hypothetical protein
VRSPPGRASETGPRLSARPGMGRGEARASQVPGPSSSYVPWSHPPPETPLSSPTARRGRCGLQGIPHPGPPGSVEVAGPHAPWPTRAHASASPRPLLAPAQGGLPARAGSPLAGRDSHPLDDRRSFLKVSSLHSPSTSIAWSHCISYTPYTPAVPCPTERLWRCRYSKDT